MDWLKILGSLRSDDADTASSRERKLLADEASKAEGTDETTRVALTDAQGMPIGVRLDSGEPIRIAPKKVLGHWGIWGPSGVGKSYALVLLLASLLEGGVRSVWLLDPKGETVELMARLLLRLASALPRQAADALIARVVLLQPFSDALLPPLNLLAREPGADPELKAWAIATLVTGAGGSDVGVRQETILHRSIECLIRADLPLTTLPFVLAEPRLLTALSGDLVFRETAELLGREKRDRLQGIAARVERLLRLRSTRLMLGGSPACLDFGALMADRIVLGDLTYPFGSTDVGRFVAGTLWQQLTRAILSRPNGSPPAVVAIDEWPEFLAGAGSDAATECERLLRLARSKGVSLIFLSQDLASVQAVSAALPQVIRTNIHWHLVFRTTEDWRFAIRPTGRRLRGTRAPWESEERGYLSQGEEATLLANELANLPDRTAYLVSRRYGLAPVRVFTEDLALPDGSIGTLARRITAPDVLVPADALERHAAAVDARLRGLLHGATPAAASAPSSAPPAAPPSRQPRSASSPGAPAASAPMVASASAGAKPPPSSHPSPKKARRRGPVDLG